MNPLLLLLGLIGGIGTFASLGGSGGNSSNGLSTAADDSAAEDDSPDLGDSSAADTDAAADEDTTTTDSSDSTNAETPNGISTGGSTTTTDTTETVTDTVPADTTTDTATTDTTNTDTTTAGSDTATTDTTTAGGDTTTDTTTTGTTNTDTTTTDTTTAAGDVDSITAPVQTGSSGSGGGTAPVVASGTVDVTTGRVATLDVPDSDVAGVRITSDVAHGHVTVNPDNTLALVMTGETYTGSQSFSYEVTHSDGSTTQSSIDLNVTAGAQASGWATGETHYVLATDANDDYVVETGDNHVSVYVSSANNALSLADIAQAEGVSVGNVTADFMLQNGYGQSQTMALDETAGMKLWNHVTPEGSSTSNWLLLESGHTYDNLGRILLADTHGEDELHPLYVGSYGSGSRPVMTTPHTQFQEGSTNVVIQGIQFDGGVTWLQGGNVAFDDISAQDSPVVFQNLESVTLRNSSVMDVHLPNSRDGGTWEGASDREQGMFGNHNNGLLLEGDFFDLNGWEIGYDTGSNPAGSAGQPPSIYSHNIYLGMSNSDVTIRDTISMRAASIGIQNRPGGFMEDNVMIDNNIAMNTLGGDYKGAGPVGEYSLVTDSLITSAGYKVSSYTQGRPFGLDDQGKLTSLVDNIVTHLANPNDPSELSYKYYNGFGTQSTQAYYDDTIVYNWEGAKGGSNNDQNTAGLDTNALDQTTIQNFASQLLGTSGATIADLADYLRAQDDGQFAGMVDADVILNYFQQGFGIADALRVTPQEIHFIPNDLGEGIRWDNRLNWETEDLPGQVSGDSVNLNGNHVVAGVTTTVDEIDFGPDGALNVYGGKITATGGIAGGNGALNIEGAGQFWTEGSTVSDLDITVLGGRFANTGQMTGANLDATGGQVILAADDAEYDVEAGDTLAITGDVKAGFDGQTDGVAILDLHTNSTLELTAGNNGELGEIAEFRSGALGDATNVSSGISIAGTLDIDLTGVSAAQAGATLALMSADEISGIFDTTNVSGLGGRDANIVVDYQNDTVTLQLSSGSGGVSVQTIGQETDVTAGNEDIWAALTNGQGVLSDTVTAAAMVPEDELLDTMITAA